MSGVIGKLEAQLGWLLGTMRDPGSIPCNVTFFPNLEIGTHVNSGRCAIAPAGLSWHWDLTLWLLSVAMWAHVMLRRIGVPIHNHLVSSSWD
jgi:hypothetical protein